MGCGGCRKTAAANKAKYKYLTRSQIEIRFKKFKNDHCAEFCHRLNDCNVFEYRVCKKKKATFELL